MRDNFSSLADASYMFECIINMPVQHFASWLSLIVSEPLILARESLFSCQNLQVTMGGSSLRSTSPKMFLLVDVCDVLHMVNFVKELLFNIQDVPPQN